tara:strand:+ start:605 stop:1135 length:531 start_codon:yes stop_codon:yes gene_type:complete
MANLLQDARDYKEAGNNLFREKDFEKALYNYHMGVITLKAITRQSASGSMAGIPGMSSRMKEYSGEEKAEANELIVLLHSNIAQCALSQDRPQRAIAETTSALAIDPAHVKSLYRRAIARMAPGDLHDTEKARTDLEEAFRLSPDDKAVLAAMKKLKALEAKELEKQKASYAKMFA